MEMEMEMGILGDELIHMYEEEEEDRRMRKMSSSSTGYLEDALSQFINTNKNKKCRRGHGDVDNLINNTTMYYLHHHHHYQLLQLHNCPHFTNSSQHSDNLLLTTTNTNTTTITEAVEEEEEEVTMLSSTTTTTTMDDELSPKPHIHRNPVQSPPPPHPIFSFASDSASATGVEEKRKTKPISKVVYPFALVKPGGFEGDDVATLDDINQRILMPPTRPVRHPVGDFACRPMVSLEGGLGLSGKTVVAFTRLHTQGRGTITIIRTRG